LSALDPAGPAAASISTLWWLMFTGAMVLFTLVLILFLLAYRKPALLSRISPRRWIVGGGLLMPVPILAALVFAALVLGDRLLPHDPKAEVMRVDVHARQWEWSFEYPDEPGASRTVNVLRIPANQPVDLHVSSADVIHAVWIPRLGGKIDAIPGRVTVIRLMADEPGRYLGTCAEYCGVGHTQMRFEVEAYATAAGGLDSRVPQ
jgi:cytochrome c oxidase subunit 2